jgi:hypothetical protein
MSNGNIIRAKYPNVAVAVNACLANGASFEVTNEVFNDDLSLVSYELNWQDENVAQPSDSDIRVKYQEQLDAWNAVQYSLNRINAYPSIGEQLDMIFHAGLGGDEFQAAIQAVKDAYPKPE